MFIDDIQEIKFGLMSKEEILRHSVVEVTTTKFTTEGPNENSVYDIRMGPMNPSECCPTCLKQTLECPGHFGHITLHTPIVHPLYYKNVLSFLQCFCIQCSRLLITEEHLQLWNILRLKKDSRFNAVLDRISKINFCVHCNLMQPKIQFSTKDTQFLLVYTVNEKVPIMVKEIQNIFNKVTDPDIELLGLSPDVSHPRNLIIEVLPVIPPRARPFIITDNVFCDDDITILLNEIVKINNNLKKNPSVTKEKKYVQSLAFRIKSLFDNSNGMAKHPNGKPMKGIKERLCSKDGLIRNNLMGKRQNFSSRTVIGPDPTLRVNEIAVPEHIANVLCFPEQVNRHNREELQQLVWNDGANYVVRDGKRFVLKYALAGDKRYKFKLEIGDIVERKLRDGDITILNRQPSLWKGSLMAMNIVKRPGKTIRMNLAVTASFNADFDGDEMNLFPPFSQQSRVELETLSSVPNHMVGCQSSKSNIRIVQDCLLGSYLLTKNNETFNKAKFYQLCMSLDNIEHEWIDTKLNDWQRDCPEQPLYCGFSILSLLFPRDFNYHTKKFNVRIRKGLFVSGMITKTDLGSGQHSLIRLLHKEYGPAVSMGFVNNIQFLANAYILHHGFSVGISDCITLHKNDIQTVVEKSLIEAEQYEQSTIDPNIREMKIMMSLGKARDVGMRIAKNSLSDKNRFLDTVTSGSKGDYFNLAQIMGLLGQQVVSGSRIQPQLSEGRRTLPHYDFEIKDKEEEYESRGFIRNSFLHGLNPREFWFHCVAGREGVCNTALKTATSGYIQRKMVKLLEDCQIRYDGTVRNSVDSIISFDYGGDQLDGTETVFVNDMTPQFCDIQRLAEKLNCEFEQ